MRKRMMQGRNRRGATLVLVAIMLLIMGGMAAFAVDIARVYAGVTEIQTGADAAALAGAHRLMKVPGVSAASGTVAFAASNNAFGTPVSITQADVEGGIWNPATATFTAGAWTTANAVRVGVTKNTRPGFGAMMGVGNLSPRRRGTAWIANQATLDCIKPWGISTSAINTLLSYPITTQAGVNDLATRGSTLNGQYALTMVVGPDITNPNGSPNIAPTVFSALTGSNSSRKEYQNAIIDLGCDGNADYSVGNSEATTGQQPGNGNGDVPRTTANAVELNLNGQQGVGGRATCAPQVGNDATCYDPVTNAAGVTVTVAAITPVAQNSVNVNVLLSFRLMCVYRGGNQPGSGRAQETCPWLTAAGRSPANNYVQGTLVGFPMVSEAKLGPGNTLGNAIGTAQKLVLVQ